MPDLERMTNKLAYELAETPEQRAWVDGWIAGKRTARKQVAVVLLFVAVLAIIVVAHIPTA